MRLGAIPRDAVRLAWLDVRGRWHGWRLNRNRAAVQRHERALRGVIADAKDMQRA